ncbi:MAG: hypothetical protein ABI036_13780 [Fibrobacteria bacterium]
MLEGCDRGFENPSDPDTERFTVESKAFVRLLGSADRMEGDTLSFVGGVTSAPVEADGLVIRYDWDLNGDGQADMRKQGPDTVSFAAQDPGDHMVGLVILDKAGFSSSAKADFRVRPSLDRLFAVKLDAREYDSACPVYAQEPALMRLALALSQFTVEKNKEEGIGATDFALKLAKALTGSVFPLQLLAGFDYGFSNGVYHFRNDGFDLDVAFQYGSGMTGHTEGDTIRANLFELDSYVSDFGVSGFPPEFSYDRGPLADLIDGDIDVDLDDIRHPDFAFRVDFDRIRMSLLRSNRTLLVLSNAEITLANALFFTLYEGKARMAPTYPPELIRLYGRDSLRLDLAGTKVSSPELPIVWSYEENGKRDSAVYRLSLTQETLRQDYRFGDADGVKKVFGTYAAVNRLGQRGDLQAVYFQGGYSSTAPDSARFYCKEPMAEKDYFGAAAFETATAGRGAFASPRYGYRYTFPFSNAEIWEGAAEAVPPGIR